MQATTARLIKIILERTFRLSIGIDRAYIISMFIEKMNKKMSDATSNAQRVPRSMYFFFYLTRSENKNV
jgi:hypothetical protein